MYFDLAFANEEVDAVVERIQVSLAIHNIFHSAITVFKDVARTKG